MALRLRRGTDAERLLITPLQGELIYTIDTKQLYAGDGTTAGGTLVSADAATTLESLTDTDLAGKTNGQVLSWNSSSGNWEPKTLVSSIADGVVEGSNYQINIVSDDSTILVNSDTNEFTGFLTGDVTGNVTGNVTGDVTGNVTGNLTGNAAGAHTGTLVGDVTGNVTGDVLGNVTGNLSGNAFGDHQGTFTGVIAASGSFDGDITGSVFGDDSTLIVDGVNNQISAQINTNQINSSADGPIVLQSADRTPVRISAVTDGSLGGFPYIEYLSIKGTFLDPESLAAGDIVGGWKVTGYDSVSGDGKISSLWISAFEDDAVVTDNYPKSSATLLISKGGNTYNQFMFGSEGEFKAPGAITPGVFADAAARDSGITTPTAGMTVFNTALQKFQGYVDDTGLAGGGASNSTPGWVNLN